MPLTLRLEARKTITNTPLTTVDFNVNLIPSPPGPTETYTLLHNDTITTTANAYRRIEVRRNFDQLLMASHTVTLDPAGTNTQMDQGQLIASTFNVSYDAAGDNIVVKGTIVVMAGGVPLLTWE